MKRGETCDRCGPNVPAATKVILPSGGKLTFCGHHTKEFRKNMQAKQEAKNKKSR